MAEPLPFEGLKVADFSWVVVGPTTSKYLADHGATTVRVETSNPLDILRVAGPFKDNVPGPDRTQFFGDSNTSKLGLTLDLKNPAGVALAHRLISWADVFIESFTPGTVDSLGIGYQTARSPQPVDHHGQHLPHGPDRPRRGFRRVRVSRRGHRRLL